MENIIDSWKHTLFIQPLFELVLLITFICVVLNRKQDISMKLVPFYLGAFVVVRVTVNILHVYITDPADFNMMSALLSYFLCWIEFITFFWYLYHVNKGSRFRLPTWVLGILGMLHYLYKLPQILPSLREKGFYSVHMVYVAECIFLLIMCGFYLLRLRTNEDRHKTAQKPAFWFFFGMLVYLAGNLPIRLLIDYLYITGPDLYSVFFIATYTSYIILMLLILIAYLSPSEKILLTNKPHLHVV